MSEPSAYRIRRLLEEIRPYFQCWFPEDHPSVNHYPDTKKAIENAYLNGLYQGLVTAAEEPWGVERLMQDIEDEFETLVCVEYVENVPPWLVKPFIELPPRSLVPRLHARGVC